MDLWMKGRTYELFLGMSQRKNFHFIVIKGVRALRSSSLRKDALLNFLFFGKQVNRNNSTFMSFVMGVLLISKTELLQNFTKHQTYVLT